jgi:hypothetical protein
MSENSSSQNDGLDLHLKNIDSRPSNILLTAYPNIRITPVFKVLKNKYDDGTHTGTPNFHYSYSGDGSNGNNWNNNLIPGFKAVFGYNMVNVSYHDIIRKKQKLLFEQPVLINTIYYPTDTRDTLMGKPVLRKHIIVSVYDMDTNKDSFINDKDLRHIYLYDLTGNKISTLVPENLNIFKSEYDLTNDYLFVFAKKDTNSNGKSEEQEPVQIYWISLSNPLENGIFY